MEAIKLNHENILVKNKTKPLPLEKHSGLGPSTGFICQTQLNSTLNDHVHSSTKPMNGEHKVDYLMDSAKVPLADISPDTLQVTSLWAPPPPASPV